MHECGDLLARRIPGGVSAWSGATAGVPGWGSVLCRSVCLGVVQVGSQADIAIRAGWRDEHTAALIASPTHPTLHPAPCLHLLPPASPACTQLRLLHDHPRLPRRHLRRVVPPRLLQVGGWWVEWCVCGGGMPVALCGCVRLCRCAAAALTHPGPPPLPLPAAGTGRRACPRSAAAPAPRATTPRASAGL